MMKAKGTAIIATLPFIKEKFGDEAVSRWLDSLSPEARAVYSAKIMLVEWYDLRSIVIEPAAKVCELFYAGNSKGYEEITKFNASESLSGVYKFFLKLTSPEAFLKKASTIMSTYYSPSVIEVAESAKGRMVLRVTEFEEWHELFEVGIKAWIEKALEILGAKQVAISITKSFLRGDAYTEYEIKWG